MRPSPRRRGRSSGGLAGTYGLVACVSGRTAADAARVVGVDGIRYVGEHGLELDPEAARWTARLAEFAATVDWPHRARQAADRSRSTTGAPTTRRRPDLRCARWPSARSRPGFGRAGAARCSRSGRRRRRQGHRGAQPARGRALDRALYAGDDATDLDAFRGLDGLEVAVRVAVVSEEAPPTSAGPRTFVVGEHRRAARAAPAALAPPCARRRGRPRARPGALRRPRAARLDGRGRATRELAMITYNPVASTTT